MYTAKTNIQPDEAIVREFIRNNGFGILVSTVEGKPWATHIPMVLNEDGTKLSGHVAKANKQWKHFDHNEEVMAIFNGPHAYISSSWYDHENVPTWNYVVAHVYGTISILEGDQLITSLKHLVDQYEKQSEKPVSIEGMNPDYLAREMKGLVGFDIDINRIESSYKLSQNRDHKNHSEIVRHLEKRDDDDSRKIAALMKENRKA